MNKILTWGLFLFSAFTPSQTNELNITYNWIIKIHHSCAHAKGCFSSYEYIGKVPVLIGTSAEEKDDSFTFNFNISKPNNSQFTLDVVIDDKTTNRFQFTQKFLLNRPIDLLYKDDKIEIDGRLFITD